MIKVKKLGLIDWAVIALTVIQIILLIMVLHYRNAYVDALDTIEIKNNRIQELLTDNYNCKMAQDETYELFMSCVYPDGIPEYEPSYE